MKYTLIAWMTVLLLSACVQIVDRNQAFASLTSLNSFALDFGDVVVGETKSLTFTVINDSQERATDVGILDSLAPFSVQSGTCPSVLAPGQRCEFQVSFSPTQLGLSSLTLSLSYDDGRQVISAAVTVKGVGISPQSEEPFRERPLD